MSRFVGVSSVLLVSVCLWDYGASKVRGSGFCCRRPIRVASRWMDLSPLDADVIFGTHLRIDIWGDDLFVLEGSL